METRTVRLQIATLRKKKGMGQRELASLLGVTHQTISKWETGAGMPDISLLPALSTCFGVSVDALLGLIPVETEYVPTGSDDTGYWTARADYLARTRKTMWNADYARFLVREVWRIDQPIQLMDFGCGSGFLGELLLPFLPAGSSYTGLDHSGELLALAAERFEGTQWPVRFIHADIQEWPAIPRYDVAICQALLRHQRSPASALDKMIQSVKPGGWVICVDVNREFESDGLHIHGMDYASLCEHAGYEAMWKRELSAEGRDYAIAMRIPFLMHERGLVDVDTRINDKVHLVLDGEPKHAEHVADLVATQGWTLGKDANADEMRMAHFINHGMDRADAEAACRKEHTMAGYVHKHKESVSFLQTRAMLVTYGRKPTQDRPGN